MHVNEWVLTPCEDLYDEREEETLKMWLLLYIHAGDKPPVQQFLKNNRPYYRGPECYESRNDMWINGCSVMGDIFLVKYQYGEAENVELGTFDLRVPVEDIMRGK